MIFLLSFAIVRDTGVDSCRNDAHNDKDTDGVCDGVDSCRGDALNDGDSDGVCDGVDSCLDDALNDADLDGVCGEVDSCEVGWSVVVLAAVVIVKQRWWGWGRGERCVQQRIFPRVVAAYCLKM